MPVFLAMHAEERATSARHRRDGAEKRAKKCAESERNDKRETIAPT